MIPIVKIDVDKSILAHVSRVDDKTLSGPMLARITDVFLSLWRRFYRSSIDLVTAHLTVALVLHVDTIQYTPKDYHPMPCANGTRHTNINGHIDGLVQNCNNSIANAVELQQSCTSHRYCCPMNSNIPSLQLISVNYAHEPMDKTSKPQFLWDVNTHSYPNPVGCFR